MKRCVFSHSSVFPAALRCTLDPKEVWKMFIASNRSASVGLGCNIFKTGLGSSFWSSWLQGILSRVILFLGMRYLRLGTIDTAKCSYRCRQKKFFFFPPPLEFRCAGHGQLFACACPNSNLDDGRLTYSSVVPCLCLYMHCPLVVPSIELPSPYGAHIHLPVWKMRPLQLRLWPVDDHIV